MFAENSQDSQPFIKQPAQSSEACYWIPTDNSRCTHLNCIFKPLEYFDVPTATWKPIEENQFVRVKLVLQQSQMLFPTSLTAPIGCLMLANSQSLDNPVCTANSTRTCETQSADSGQYSPLFPEVRTAKSVSPSPPPPKVSSSTDRSDAVSAENDIDSCIQSASTSKTCTAQLLTCKETPVPLPEAAPTDKIPVPEPKKLRSRRRLQCTCPNCLEPGAKQAKFDNGRPKHLCHNPDCGRTFYHTVRLRNHLQTHQCDKKNFFCAKCRKGFVLKSDIRKHLQKSHAKYELKNRTKVRASDGTQKHAKRRTVCPVEGCGKVFYYVSNFNAHSRLHNDFRPYPCDWYGCGKKFTFKCYLVEHMQIHTR